MVMKLATANPTVTNPTVPDPIWTAKQALKGSDPATENIPWSPSVVPTPNVAVVAPVAP